MLLLVKSVSLMQVPKAVKKFSTTLPPPRKEEKKAKGIQSEAVRAFLEKQKREEEEKGK